VPKLLETYNPFGGGINSKDDARDIAKNELVDCVNIMVDAVGKVRTSGSEADVSTNEFTIDFESVGDGLFVWNADADWDKDDGVGSTASPTEFIALYDSANGQVDLSPSSDESDYSANPARGAITSTMDMGANTGGITSGKATFYAADNALRVLNGNFLQNTALSGKWLGFINRDYFPHASGNFLIDASPRWYVDGNKLPYPTRGIWSNHVVGTASASSSTTAINLTGGGHDSGAYGELNGGSYIVVDVTDADVHPTHASNSSATQIAMTTTNDQDWDSRDYRVHPPDGTGFCVDIETTSSTDSMWANGTYHIGQSFIYAGGQESRVTSLKGGSLTLEEDEYPTFIVTGTAGAIGSGTGYNPRIIGGRIYVRRADRGAKWRLVVDMSFERGTRMSLNHGFDYWNYATISSVHYLYTDSYGIKAPSPETFQTINGYDSQQPANSFGWGGWGAEAAVVANQRAFLGNVKYKDESGSVTVHSDRVLFSPVGQYDVFPTNHYIDIGLGDGDNIVNIIESSDRLMVFKKKKLYVVNIGAGSDAGWFIEGEYAYKGISNKAAAFKTDMGCVWANINGCFLYDGKQVIDLTEKLNDETWETFIGTSAETVVVGYIPKKNQVVVVSDADMASSTDNEVYIYDIRTRSWVRNDSLFTQDSNKAITNFQIYNNDLIYARQVSSTESNLQKINPSSAEQKMELITKDEDFGNPGIKKKFYKIYVNYRLNGGSSKFLECRHSLNGSKAGATVSEARSGGSKAYTLFSDTRATLNNDNTWRIATFEASTPFSGQSISTYFATVSAADGSTQTAAKLEINEVTIEWRPLRARAEAS